MPIGKIDFKNIPIYIISFNRLTMLKQLIENLEDKGYTNVQIIDNHSSYPPLLEYYKKIKNKIHYLDKNYGHMAFWTCGQFDDVIQNQYYAVTDSDILPISECPDNFMELFYELLIKNPDFTKVGFSLKIDNIPNSNPQKDFIVKWESEFYSIKYKYKFKNKDFYIYDADIDTTFALYKPQANMKKFGTAIRTGVPYQSLHLPWYKTTFNEEDEYYKKHVTNGVSNYSVDLKCNELKNKFKITKLKFIQNLFSIINIRGYKNLVIFGFKFKLKIRKIHVKE